jgi:hypothetical protein
MAYLVVSLCKWPSPAVFRPPRHQSAHNNRCRARNRCRHHVIPRALIVPCWGGSCDSRRDVSGTCDGSKPTDGVRVSQHHADENFDVTILCKVVAYPAGTPRVWRPCLPPIMPRMVEGDLALVTPAAGRVGDATGGGRMRHASDSHARAGSLSAPWRTCTWVGDLMGPLPCGSGALAPSGGGGDTLFMHRAWGARTVGRLGETWPTASIDW